MVITYYSGVWINRVGCQSFSWSAEQGNDYFPALVRALKLSLVRRVRPSHPASACSFSILRLNLVLTHGITPDSRGGIHVYLFRHTPSDRSRVYQVMQLRIVGVHCRKSTGTGPVVFKVVPVTDGAFASHHEPVNMRCSFPKTTIGMKWSS